MQGTSRIRMDMSEQWNGHIRIVGLAFPAKGESHAALQGRCHRRRDCWNLGSLPLGQARVDGCRPDRTRRIDRGVDLACSSGVSCAQRRSEHRRPSGLHHPPLSADRGGKRAELRASYDRGRDLCL